MEFSETDLKPTYRFRINIPGSSHAFDIAERYKLSHKVITRARELAGTNTTRLDDLIESLGQKEQDMIAKRTEAERELGKARIEKIEYERLHNDLLLQKKVLLSKASEQASALVSEANTLIERAIREARESAQEESAPAKKEERKTPQLAKLRTAQKEEFKQFSEKVDEHRSEAAKSAQTEELPLEVGAKVKLFSNPGQIGEVISLKGKDAEVIFGSMTMKVNSDKLEVVSKKEARKEERATIRQTGSFYDEQFSHRIDLRGEYGDEGVMHVEKYLSDATVRNLERVEIIHGMGTGALGRRIQQSLKGSPFVESFRYGEPNEGGAGVTIVELKK
jgi:DNA mismatch repair protein MutS2